MALPDSTPALSPSQPLPPCPRQQALAWALLIAAHAGAGCSLVDSAAEAAHGCAGYAAGYCQALARCGPDFLAPYPSLDMCQTALASGCVESLRQPDVLGTGAGALACGELMASVDCASIANRELPVGCQPPAGRRGDGARCSVGAQCASTHCRKPSADAAFGTCEEPGRLGAPCVSYDDCGSGLVCTSFQHCASLARAGEPCNDAQPCRAPLACSDGSCAAPALPSTSASCNALASCSGPPADAMASCYAFAAAMCAGLGGCSARLIESVYGAADGCVARTQQSCMDGLRLSDTASTALGVLGCASALPSVSCNALLENALPDTCRLAAGARALGAACASDAQCATTRCARPEDSACGTCAALANAGEPCRQNSDCAARLVCGAAHVCRLPASAGSACDDTQPCAYPLACVAGTCQIAAAKGATCDATRDGCDRYAGLACAPDGTCQPWLSAAENEACGYTARGWAVCTAGASCVSSSCRAPLSMGSACPSDGSQHCAEPALCLGGICSLVDPAVCR